MNKAVLVLLFFFVALVGISASVAAGAAVVTPAPTATTALRTPVPSWTLPFALAATATPEPLTPPELIVGTAAPPKPTQVDPTALPPTPVPPTATPYIPPRLVIPKLKLDQSIVPVLITDGSWNLDALDKNVGWLTTTGRAPGEDLAMALAGHVNLSLGNPGPFVDLKKVKIGDQVIYRSDGWDYTYTVQKLEKVKPDAVQELYVADGTKLLLVTCSDWSYFWSRYAQRLIITADLTSTDPTP